MAPNKHEKIRVVAEDDEQYGRKKKNKKKGGPLITYKAEDFLNQFDDLTEQSVFLIKGLCNADIECLICRNPIFQKARTWNCKQCSQPLHLSCIQNWIKSIFF